MMIIVPCKRLDHGKSRLAEVLAPGRRRRLCADFLDLTLRRATELVSSRVVLLTNDRKAAAIGALRGVRVLPDLGSDMNTALVAARGALLSEGLTEPVMILPIDLPFASTQALAAAASMMADVVVAPDRRDEGTNLLCLSVAAFRALQLAFGPGSFQRHCENARAAGLSLAIADDARLALDIDQPEDYDIWVAMAASGAEKSYSNDVRLWP
jgi:2-phospho-L-lactate/phosphoenolpyruvate guanylyltransferase